MDVEGFPDRKDLQPELKICAQQEPAHRDAESEHRREREGAPYVKDESGGGSDPNIAAKLEQMNEADPDIKAKKKPAHTRLPVSTVTSEAAAGKTGGEAIVIVPTPLSAKRVDVLFHLHGHTIGYRQAKHGKGKPPPPRDIQYDRIEQQLLAAAQDGLPMVGILPQGTFYSTFGPGGQLGVNVDRYVKEVFGGVSELKGIDPGRVTLSGWSGAGKAIGEMITGSEAAGSGKAVPGGETGSVLPVTDNFEGLFLFDAIYGDWLDPVWRFLQTRLHADLAELVKHGSASRDPATAARAQEDYLLTKGFRFRGIYTIHGGCKTNYEALRDDDLKATWFDSADVQKLPASVREKWSANYQIGLSGERTHNIMIGKQSGSDPENLLKALRMLLPKAAPPTSVPAAAPAPVTAPAPHGRPSPASHRSRHTEPVAPRATAPPATLPTKGSPDELLVAAAVALGRAGKGSARLAGGTLLHQEDLRSALDNRAKLAALNQRFQQAQVTVGAAPEGAQRLAVAQQQASDLVRLVELQFILDPKRSALDLLPPDRAQHWRDFKWEKNDYPKGPKGAHEAEAKAMTREMTVVRPERRPNQDSAAVMIEEQATPQRWQFIAEHSPVPR